METGRREQIAYRKWVTCLEFCFVIVVLVICEDRRRNGNPWTRRHYSLEGQGHTIYKGKDHMIYQITQKLQSCLCFLYYAVFVSSGRTINSEIYREHEFDEFEIRKVIFDIKY